jgi:hypothetical protein
MEAITLQDIERRVTELAGRVGASGSVLPTFGHSADGGRPHIEVDHRGFHYVVVERGEEQSRETTNAPDDLLWHVFQAVTFSLASDYECAHRDELQDCRRLIFARQLQLLELLSPEWARRRAEHLRTILDQHPFDDYSSVRVALTVRLRNAGCSDAEAWRQACEQYPPPVVR